MFLNEKYITSAIVLAAAVIVGLMVRIEKQPIDPARTRLIPTTLVILVSGMVGFLALVHLVNLLGFHTGR